MKRSPLHRRTSLRPRSRKPQPGIIKDAAYMAWLHTQPCIVHGLTCPLWAVPGGLLNVLEVHHIDYSHRNVYRTVPACKQTHQYASPRFGGLSRAELEAHAARLQKQYQRETGRIIPASAVP